MNSTCLKLLCSTRPTSASPPPADPKIAEAAAALSVVMGMGLSHGPSFLLLCMSSGITPSHSEVFHTSLHAEFIITYLDSIAEVSRANSHGYSGSWCCPVGGK